MPTHLLRFALFICITCLSGCFVHNYHYAVPTSLGCEDTKNTLRRINYNAVIINERPIPLYKASYKSEQQIAYSIAKNEIKALNANGDVLWIKRIPGGKTVFRTSDINSDGWFDLVAIKPKKTQEKCGTQYIFQRQIVFLSGRTGELFSSTIPDEKDKCWVFPQKAYPTPQWAQSCTLFGSTNNFVLLRYYEHRGRIIHFNNSKIMEKQTFHFPSVREYGNYKAAKRSPFRKRKKYVVNSHLGNGLVYVTPDNDKRLLFFTSARVVQYDMETANLISDVPFLSRKKISGRNYGLVTKDPHSKNIVLLAGTSVRSVYEDMRKQKRVADFWGMIERHITIYNPQTHKLDNRFFSYAHDKMKE